MTATAPEPSYTAAEGRYATDRYRRCGNSGLKLPTVSLGLWQHCFDVDLVRSLVRTGFDRGLTHFDLANNYGPPPGAAESAFGVVLAKDLKPYRDELIIATKAGYTMWAGPYGDWGSRKYLIASLDQSLARMGLDYVDIFYHHRPDPNTPLEETMQALADIVRSGKALYAGISNYRGERILRAQALARELRLPLIINQVKYSLLTRGVESEVIPPCSEAGQGVIAFSPLEQGLLTDRYLHGVPDDSRAGKGINRLSKQLTPEFLTKIAKLNAIAVARGQTLAQMALTWILRHRQVVSVLIGASRPDQVIANLDAGTAPMLSAEELALVDAALA